MLYEIKLNADGNFTSYCPRPLVPGDIRAYKVTIKAKESLEGYTLTATAVRSDGQVITDMGKTYAEYAEYTLASNMYSTSGEMHLLLSVISPDGSCLTAKEVIFTVSPETGSADMEADDRLPVLSSIIEQCNDILNDCKNLGNNYGGLVESYRNLANPENISISSTNGVLSISGLTPGQEYCFNFIPYAVMGITEAGADDVNYTIRGDATYISAEDMNYTSLSIPFNRTLDYSHFMFMEGNTIPPYFKAYSSGLYLNDSLLLSVYSEIDKLKPTIKVISSNGGEVYLSGGKVHKLTLSEDIKFYFPEVSDFSQILVQVNVTQPVSINWNTTYFFDSEVPDITVGEYNFIFEYDGAWYAGVVPKGQVEL